MWHNRFLDLAARIASWSKDPSSQVGAVIVRPDRTIASVGFNGFPRGVHDNPDRLENRSTKYALVVHAEMNAILSAHSSVAGCTIYVTPFHPCASCAGAIIQAGITKVVTCKGAPDRWAENFGLAKLMFKEANIEVVEIDA